MTVRTTSRTVIFRRPFVLSDLDEVQPAGTYEFETDEELLESVSFPVYRRVTTMIRLHAHPSHPGMSRSVNIDIQELDAILNRDAAPAD